MTRFAQHRRLQWLTLGLADSKDRACKHGADSRCGQATEQRHGKNNASDILLVFHEASVILGLFSPVMGNPQVSLLKLWKD